MNNNHLKEILVKLSEAKIRFIVCGGVAVVLHGVERMTLDLDVSVDMKSDNLNRFLTILERINLTPRAPIPASTLLDSEKIKKIVEEKNALVFTFVDLKNPFRQLDVFLTKEFAFEYLIKSCVEIDVGGYKIFVISKEKLIEMKRSIVPQREKDAIDIKELTKLN